MTILCMVSLNIPGTAQQIQGAILNFVYLDMLQTSSWMNLYPADDASQPLNDFFNSNGYPNTHYMTNLASTFVYIILVIALYLSYPMLHIIA